MIKAKKSLGQNFLIDKKILNIIVNHVDLKNKSVLEVGPGTGNLTNYILEKKPKKIITVEKDTLLAKNLNTIFNNKIKIINEDILKIDEYSLFNEKAVVLGNLPYNISTEILTRWIINLKDIFWFESLILMFQKEVADRIISKSNNSDYGRLSIISNWKLNIEKICDIQPESFSPRPKINSSLLFFSPKKKYFKIRNPKNLEKITRIFFQNRRKMIKKSFNQIFNGNSKIINTLNLDLSLRPQNLDFETYYKLTEEYENLLG